MKNLHRAGTIDDSMLFHVTGLKEREQKYHKCSGNSAKYFSDLVTARDVEAMIFQQLPLPLPHLSLSLPLPLTKMRKRPLTIFLTFVVL